MTAHDPAGHHPPLPVWRLQPFGLCRGDVAGPSGERFVDVAQLKCGWWTDVIEADEVTAATEWRVMLRVDDEGLGQDAAGWSP